MEATMQSGAEIQTSPTSSDQLGQLDLSRIAQDLQIRKVQVESVVQLLDEGNTIPFIARYRKERTGGIHEDILRTIAERVRQLRQLADRKRSILKSIEGQGKLTPELRSAIIAADNPKRLEDLYLPFKPKKRTLATAAREKGLEPLALAIWYGDPAVGSLDELLQNLLDPEKDLNTPEDVLLGVQHILAELVAECADVRAVVRSVLWDTGRLTTRKSDKLGEGKGLEYKDYFQFTEPVRNIPPHRILAINRGEKEHALQLKLEWDEETGQRLALERLPLPPPGTPVDILALAPADSGENAEPAPEATPAAPEGQGETAPAAEVTGAPIPPAPEPAETASAPVSEAEKPQEAPASSPEETAAPTEEGTESPTAAPEGDSPSAEAPQDAPAEPTEGEGSAQASVETPPAQQERGEFPQAQAPEGSNGVEQPPGGESKGPPSPPEGTSSPAESGSSGAAPVQGSSAHSEPGESPGEEGSTVGQGPKRTVEPSSPGRPPVSSPLTPLPPLPERGPRGGYLAALAQRAEALKSHPHEEFLKRVTADALARLLVPSLENEIRRELTTRAKGHAVSVFARNLRNKLLGAPLRGKRVLAIDPAFRTGCKVAILDEIGNLLENSVIYPHAPQNQRREALRKLETLARKYQTSVIAIGNGTACRETEELVSELIARLEARRQGLPVEDDLSTESATASTTEKASEAPTPAGPILAPAVESKQPPPEAAPTIPPEEESPEGSPAEASQETTTAEGGNAEGTPESAAAGVTDQIASTPSTEAQATPGEGEQEGVTSPATEASEQPTPTQAEEPTPQAPVEQAPAEEQPGPEAGAGEGTATAQDQLAGAEEGANTAPAENAAAPAESEAAPAVETVAAAPPQPEPAVPEEPLPDAPPELAYVIVPEAGASDYSTSPVGLEEFPHLDATVRGTISIGRRLQDPLSELVKIDPQHVGVGLYQHDVSPKQLRESLEGVIESCVNAVGVDLNTASVPLLRHVSGMNQLVARDLVEHRKNNGPFRNREQLMQVPGIGEARYIQAAGFLKIVEGDNPLDQTWIHPESYPIAQQVLNELGTEPASLQDREKLEELRAKLKDLSPEEVANRLQAGIPTVRDILDALARPGRDPREDLPPPVFKKGILKIEDLQPGMELRGQVLNVVDFGCFVDIGLKDSGLVHISQMANRYVKSPYEVVAVGDIVTVWVLSVDQERHRVSLTMIPPGTERKPAERRGRREGGRDGGREGAREGGREGAREGGREGAREGREGGSSRRIPPDIATPGKPSPTAARPDLNAPRPPEGEREGRPQGGSLPPRGRDARSVRGQRDRGQGGPGRGRESRETTPTPPPPPRKPRRQPPKPKLSADALAGKESLSTFGELAAFWEAKETPPSEKAPEKKPVAEQKPPADTPSAPAPTQESSQESPPQAPPAEESTPMVPAHAGGETPGEGDTNPAPTETGEPRGDQAPPNPSGTPSTSEGAANDSPGTASGESSAGSPSDEGQTPEPAATPSGTPGMDNTGTPASSAEESNEQKTE